MKSVLRIGTRDSKLALWQAEQAGKALEKKGHRVEIVPVKSAGDLDLESPLHEMGETGIFTKTLDLALLEDKIDVAVHSLKDVPTRPPEGILIAATLPRHNPWDVLVFNEDPENKPQRPHTIATGSIRRRAQWLAHYPGHRTENLRGNVISRLEKLENSGWSGAIFAAAGLERLGIRPKKRRELHWMVPAPAQGIIGLTCRQKDAETAEILGGISDKKSWAQALAERSFLRTLEGGCSAPIGALAQYEDDGRLLFKGVLLSTDGLQKIRIDELFAPEQAAEEGCKLALKVLDQGGEEIMKKFRDELQNR